MKDAICICFRLVLSLYIKSRFILYQYNVIVLLMKLDSVLILLGSLMMADAHSLPCLQDCPKLIQISLSVASANIYGSRNEYFPNKPQPHQHNVDILQ
jgi:hypothetical protein